MTDQQINQAANAVRNCEIYLDDGWRCDFCESGCDCDERRKNEALEEIMVILNCSYFEALNFYDRYK